jgi:predicted alpha/beta hydrolase
MAVSAEPLWFGSAARPWFGWLHRPAAPATASAGLVICNPFGNEALCAHRTIRHLARQAAAAGFAALRFDYDGTGDSAGHGFEPQRLQAWLKSIHGAVDVLRESSGVTRVYLAGLRLGATLAALACLERRDLAGLIAVAPVVHGSAYVRELRLLQRAMDARRDVAPHERSDFLESAGFLLTAETQTQLRAIDLTRLDVAPCQQVLVLDRAEMPIDLALIPAWRERGGSIERRAIRGYTEMMLDPHDSVVPQELLAGALEWLRSEESGHGGDAVTMAPAYTALRRVSFESPQVPDPVTSPDAAVAIEETLLEIGAEAPLFGVLTTPAARAPHEAAAVLLLNAGAVHHVGPNRLYVALARHLARLGHAVLRLDIAGIGDSDPRPGEKENVVYPSEAPRDLAVALDYLRRQYGAHDVRIVGLCSGAYYAFKGAVAQLPLEGALIVNPLTFFWKPGMSLKYPPHRVAEDMARYRRNVFAAASWRKLLAGQVDPRQLSGVLWERARGSAVTPLRALARLAGRPLADDLPTELLRAGAATRLHFVFSGGDPGAELLRQGAGRTAQRMRARGELSITNIDGADHTFTDLGTRRALVTVLTQALQAPDRSALKPTARTSAVPRAPLRPYS